ncbi:hypothetical protein ACFOGJ_12910 [Marinibaculum pumilum]|uniref:Secreted protein n=1 Tax=Marinibaculum pumilum TaxID=1766165 RepID=A0ABV7L0Q6_9PROT
MIRKSTTALAAVAALGLGAAAIATPAQAETAQSITFNISSVPQKSGDWTIESAFIGNMADPNACTQYYYQPPPATSWTWNNQGNNLNPFGIVVNFKKSGGTGDPTQTAFRCVTVDPNNMPSANNTVDISLTACNVNGAEGNPGLLVNSTSPGVTVKAIGGQPSCS